MAIQDDFVIDVVNLKITYTTSFVDDRPPFIYTVNELYSYLQDTFDEPGYLQYPTPMSAQTPTQYTLVNKWFMDDNTMKALYGGSIQTNGWTKSGAAGITQLRWTSGSTDAPTSGDLGVTLTGGTSTATGVLLAVDTVRQVAWVRNTSSAQFSNNENVTGTGVDLQTETNNGVLSGNSIWANLFSVGSLQSNTEIYVGQEDDYMGGRAYHGSTAAARAARRVEKVDEWWDSDVDFSTGSPNLLGGAGHFDILVKVNEAGVDIDGRRLAVFARQFSKVYSHFELVGGVGNFVVPFASTGADLNSADGPYTIAFDGRTGNDLEVGDVLENASHGTGTNDPLGRLRAVVTAVTGGASATGTFDYYLIGENEPLASTDRTLVQLADNDDLIVRGDNTDLDVNGSPTLQGPALVQGITITYANTQVDVDEDTTDEEYACTIDCNNVPLADVYKRVMFLTSRGNQDGTVADTQDTLLPSAVSGTDEASEFYRAIGDVVFNWDNKTGTPPAEGVFVTNANASWTASGVVVSLSGAAGSSGVAVLTQVKGTWSDGDTVAVPGSHGTNEITVNEPASGFARSIVDNTGAPFGSFAGGRWFVARGVVLANVPAADANNWETTDLAGFRKVPPTVRTLTFAGLQPNDRAVLLEVATPGGIDYVNNHNTWSSGGAIGSSSFVMTAGAALDVPSTGWVRHVDSSSTVGAEYRYEYSSISGSTVTLRTVSPGDDVCDAGGSTTLLVDTGIATSFGTDGNPKVGMMVRNVTSGGIAIVLRKVDNDTIETTPLSSGSWATGNSYELNTVVVAMAASDTFYWPFIDDTSISTSLVKTIKYVSDTPCVARARFSDPDVGGTRILPFSQTNVTITDANLTVTAIRTADTIASP